MQPKNNPNLEKQYKSALRRRRQKSVERLRNWEIPLIVGSMLSEIQKFSNTKDMVGPETKLCLAEVAAMGGGLNFRSVTEDGHSLLGGIHEGLVPISYDFLSSGFMTTEEYINTFNSVSEWQIEASQPNFQNTFQTNEEFLESEDVFPTITGPEFVSNYDSRITDDEYFDKLFEAVNDEIPMIIRSFYAQMKDPFLDITLDTASAIGGSFAYRLAISNGHVYEIALRKAAVPNLHALISSGKLSIQELRETFEDIIPRMMKNRR